MPFIVSSLQLRSLKKLGNDADFFDQHGNINSRVLFFRMFGTIAHVQMHYQKADAPENIEKRLKKLGTGKEVDIIFKLVVNKGPSQRGFIEEHSASNENLYKIGDQALVHVLDGNYAILHRSDVDDKTLKKLAACVEGNVEARSRKNLHKFSMITHQYGMFELEYFDMKPYDIEIKKQYNDGFEKADSKIRSFLDQTFKSGIVLLHGVYGSGKTTYIRHLINKTEKNFIYIPINMVGALNDPEFLPFITQYRDSVLIIEDCEHLIQSRKSGTSSSALVNLLNMGDGLLGDALQLKIICTFNAELADIDAALLRKGRLIVRYYFDNLQTDKSVALQQQLKRKPVVESAMTLADIYNAEENDLLGEHGKNSIGFKRQ